MGAQMLTACWSVKGGSGATVVAAALAAIVSRGDGAVLLADLAGDLPAALGAPEPSPPGLAQWMEAGPDVAPDSLDRLTVDIGTVRLLPWCGEHPLAASDGERFAAAVASHPAVVADCGTAPLGAARAVALAADRSLLVIRPCYLALRRALASPVRASGVVLVEEAGRALTAGDVSEVLGVPVVASVPWDGTIARSVDAGLLAGRLPRALRRSLEDAA